MPRIVQVALVLLSCALFATEVFGQAGQVTNPVPLTAPSINTTTTTCQINCDTVAMTCLGACVPTTASTLIVVPGSTAVVPSTATTSTCNLNCTTQQLVCKQRC
jgi:hypothetical protein